MATGVHFTAVSDRRQSRRHVRHCHTVVLRHSLLQQHVFGLSVCRSRGRRARRLLRCSAAPRPTVVGSELAEWRANGAMERRTHGPKCCTAAEKAMRALSPGTCPTPALDPHTCWLTARRQRPARQHAQFSTTEFPANSFPSSEQERVPTHCKNLAGALVETRKHTKHKSDAYNMRYTRAVR